MDNLRENKDSLMAMLEAFIYDPLIGWRLLEQKQVDSEVPYIEKPQEEVQSNNQVNAKAIEAI